MGHVYIDVTVHRVDDPQRCVTLRCLADTGATDTVLPKDALEQIGLQPARQRKYELADGRKVMMGVGYALLEFQGEVTASDVVFGESAVEPILGVTALESTGFVVDPREGRLRKRAIRL